MKYIYLSILLIFFKITFCQTDSLINERVLAKQIYDTAQAALVDSNSFELLRILQASQYLIEIDNHLIDENFPELNKQNDSLQLEVNLISTIKSNLERQIKNDKKLNNGLYVLTGITGTLCIILFFMFIRRRNNIRELKRIKREHETLLSIYHNQISDLKQNLEILGNKEAELMNQLSIHRIRTIKNEDTETEDNN